MKNTKIVLGFPGCGKTHFYNGRKDLMVLDSDSSEFSWVKDEEGNNTSERNPYFPNNYIDRIRGYMGTVDIIFVSTHKIVRDAICSNFNANEIFLMYPERECKKSWIERYRKRGSTDSFVNMMNVNWDKFIDELVLEDKRFRVCVLGQNEYISDYIDIILEN